MDNYFKHFPLIRYGNTVANTVSVNLFAKVAFQKAVQQNYEVFHPYTIEEGDRPDTIAYLYYGDPGYDWIVYYSNNIVDPYHDWFMEQTVFKEFIKEKYGSVTEAQQKVKFYRSNYVEDYSMIDPSVYEGLSSRQKAFWTPLVKLDNVIFKYERKKEDVTFETNQVLQLDITLVGNTNFTSGEYVYQQSGGVTVASGTVRMCNSSTLVVSSTIGSLSTSYNIKGGKSSANATVSSIKTLKTSIPAELQSYFHPISYYEYEDEKNEERKNIRLIDVSYIEEINEEFKRLLTV